MNCSALLITSDGEITPVTLRDVGEGRIPADLYTMLDATCAEPIRLIDPHGDQAGVTAWVDEDGMWTKDVNLLGSALLQGIAGAQQELTADRVAAVAADLYGVRRGPIVLTGQDPVTRTICAVPDGVAAQLDAQITALGATPTGFQRQVGITCPSCGGFDGIEVEARTWVLLTPEGSAPDEASDSHEYDRTSRASCQHCEWVGTLEQACNIPATTGPLPPGVWVSWANSDGSDAGDARWGDLTHQQVAAAIEVAASFWPYVVTFDPLQPGDCGIGINVKGGLAGGLLAAFERRFGPPSTLA